MSKKLVAYFSASGVTAKLAKKLAEAIDADLFEIKPVEPYSEADQNWKNPLARCNKEKIGKKDVPVSGIVENMDEYDTVYLGFPIWYWAAPNVVNTFAKQYDFSKRCICFLGGFRIVDKEGNDITLLFTRTLKMLLIALILYTGKCEKIQGAALYPNRLFVLCI
mgnify:CR=1 FL=1